MVFVAFDLETTGPDPLRDEVVQLGACCRDGVFQTLVRPGRRISSGAAAVHGVSNEAVAAAEPFPTVWDGFLRWLRPLVAGAGSVVFLGHNSWVFDDSMLAAELERHELPDPAFAAEVWSADTLRAARGLDPPGVSLRLAELHRRLLAAEMGRAHDALADALAVAAIMPLLRARLEYRHFSICHECLLLRRRKRAAREHSSLISADMQTPVEEVAKSVFSERETVVEGAAANAFPGRSVAKDAGETEKKHAEYDFATRNVRCDCDCDRVRSRWWRHECLRQSESLTTASV